MLAGPRCIVRSQPQERAAMSIMPLARRPIAERCLIKIDARLGCVCVSTIPPASVRLPTSSIHFPWFSRALCPVQGLAYISGVFMGSGYAEAGVG